jgi:predicted nucleic-acid-binding protein
VETLIGIDTNVLLRLFGRDEPERQIARAKAVIIAGREEGRVLVNVIVLSEFSWTLSKRYRLPRAEVADRIERLLEAEELEIAAEDQVRDAVEHYRRGRADFPDYLIAALNRRMGCRTTMTFDQDAGDSPDMTVDLG